MKYQVSMKAFLALFLVVFMVSCAGSKPLTDSKKARLQADVRNRANKVLKKLYTIQPSAKSAIQNAAGYAVFSNFGMKILILGGGKGEGLAVSNKRNKETFMKMFEIQGGLGMGIKKFALVWIFEHQKDFDEFVNTGFELSAQYTAAAKEGEKGGALAGAISVRPGVWLYQLTEKGLALELTAKGTKYYRDSDLN